MKGISLVPNHTGDAIFLCLWHTFYRNSFSRLQSLVHACQKDACQSRIFRIKILHLHKGYYYACLLAYLFKKSLIHLPSACLLPRRPRLLTTGTLLTMITLATLLGPKTVARLTSYPRPRLPVVFPCIPVELLYLRESHGSEVFKQPLQIQSGPWYQSCEF